MKILVAEDIKYLNDNLCRLLQNSGYFDQVLSAVDGAQAINLYKEHFPEYALLDIQIPRKSGLLVADHILKREFKTRILMMTSHENEVTICGIRSLRGISGCILKSDPNFSEIISVLDKIRQGEPYFSPHFTELLHQYLCSNMCLQKILNPRQRLLLCYVGAGFRDEQIADMMDVSFAKVKNKIRVLRRLLGVTDRIDLITLAHEKGSANGNWKRLGLVGNYEVYD